MSSYDAQYQQEPSLFGDPYPEFVQFIRQHPGHGKRALDIGCGQGRDALMLAQHGYHVTGVDGSAVGIEQMMTAATQADLTVAGVVADIYTYAPNGRFDLIVLDSMLHFGKAERDQELALLDKTVGWLNPHGFLCLFIHRSAKKEKHLNDWLTTHQPPLDTVQTGYLDYTYREESSGFTQAFQYFMLIAQQIN